MKTTLLFSPRPARSTFETTASRVFLACAGAAFLLLAAVPTHAQSMSGHDMQGHDMINAQTLAGMPVSSALQVSDCWVRLLPATVPSGAYFTLKNTSDRAVVVRAAASPSYKSVMLHRTTEDNGVSHMGMAGPISVPAHGDFTFKPGGYHAMLEQPTKQLAAGGTITLYLLTGANEQATASCALKPAGASQG